MQQDLAFEYQPKTFDQFWNQTGAVAAMKQFVENGALPRSTLLRGTWGAGKSSLAKVVSQRASCVQSTGADPCYHCDGCKWVDFRIAGFGGRFLVYGGDFKFEHLQDFCRKSLGYLAPAPFGIWVPVVDELQFIDPKIQQRIVHLIDETPSARFIFCTSDMSGVEVAIQRRSHILEMPVPTEAEVIAAMLKISDQENLAATQATAARIARQWANNPRDCVKELQRLKGTGETSFNGSSERKRVTLG